MSELKTFSGRKPSQDYFELTSLIKFLKESEVKTYLEIGSRHGDTFHEIISSLPKEDTFGVAVDLPGGLWGTSKSVNTLVKVIQDLTNKGYNVDYKLGSSTSIKIVSYALNAAKWDAIFIDGDHTLKGVTADWEIYSKMSNIVIFHDIVGAGQYEKVYNNKVEVPILWESLKKEYKTLEFIGENSNMGIGVVFTNSKL